MDSEKVEWACQLSHDDWQTLLRIRNRYVIGNVGSQSEAKQHLLRMVRSELKELDRCNSQP